MTPKRYHVMTFGCRVNQADTTAIMADLERHAFTRSASHVDADVVVLNTCTVTHRSDADVRKAAQRIRRENPSAKVVVAGCFAQRAPEDLTSLGSVDAVVGHAHTSRLPIIADDVLSHPSERAVVHHTPMADLSRADLPTVDPHAFVFERTRPFVKIQDGCDAPCTYCVIPAVRGRARSASVEKILTAVRHLISDGHFEIVLAGVHLGTFGEHLTPKTNLTALVEEILEIEGLGRLRLSCIEPMAFPMRLADIAAENPKLAPHFHLPLQSGSDRILKRMVRPYRAQEFKEIVQGIRERVPDACLGTDVIVGFPGETEEDFLETMNVVESSGFDCVHVFSYSDRDGTPSTRLPHKVDPRIVKDRSKRLHALGDALWTRFLDRQVGRTLSAVTLGPSSSDDRRTSALADNYAPIESAFEVLPPNLNARFLVTGRRGDLLEGTRQM